MFELLLPPLRMQPNWCFLPLSHAFTFCSGLFSRQLAAKQTCFFIFIVFFSSCGAEVWHDGCGLTNDLTLRTTHAADLHPSKRLSARQCMCLACLCFVLWLVPCSDGPSVSKCPRRSNSSTAAAHVSVYPSLVWKHDQNCSQSKTKRWNRLWWGSESLLSADM